VSPEELAILPSNDWISAKWRPMMGIMYMVVCIFDFILFPIAWSVGLAMLHLPVTEWNPLTLQGAGLFHMAMGAVLGVAAWSRGQEKITAMNAGFATPGTMNTGYMNTGYNNGSTVGMSQQETTYTSQTPINPNTGKPMGPAQSFPSL
jgi:hypothetical protein